MTGTVDELAARRAKTLNLVTPDEARQLSPDMSVSTVDRNSWLLKSSFKYQIDPASRLLGKLNYAESKSSGSFYDGRYTEAVLG